MAEPGAPSGTNALASAEEMRVLRQVSSEINATLDLDEIYDVVLRTMDELFGFRHTLILLLDDDGEHLSVTASRGYEQHAVGAKVRVGVGVIGMVAQRRRMMRVTNLAQQRNYLAAVRRQMQAAGRGDELDALPELPGLPHARSQIAIPMCIRDALIGVFTVESVDAMPLDEHAEQLVSIVANQSAAAIHNARLYRGLERANRELEELAATLEQRVVDRTRALQEANAELREAQSRLVHAGKMASIGQLAASVAHELNTPVATVLSSSDTLARALQRLTALLEQDGARARLPRVGRMLETAGDSGRVIGEGAHRVDEIVRRLRAFTRLDEASLKHADPQSGLEDTIALLTGELGDRIEVVSDYGDVGVVACYPAALNQVFLNLLRNAIAAIEGAGTIHVRLWRADGQVHVSIADDGPGIAPERLASIFEPRFGTQGGRVAASMGLSISQRIMQDHLGELGVESEPGRGATFTLRFPDDLSARLARPSRASRT